MKRSDGLSESDTMRASVVIVVLALSAGCAWSPKPYANDPLIRTRTALPGDPHAVPPAKPMDAPQPPEPLEERVAGGIHF